MQRLRQTARRDLEGGTYLHQTASSINQRSSIFYAESRTSRRSCKAKPPPFRREQINSQRICRVSGMHAVRYKGLPCRGAHLAHQFTEMVMIFICRLTQLSYLILLRAFMYTFHQVPCARKSFAHIHVPEQYTPPCLSQSQPSILYFSTKSRCIGGANRTIPTGYPHLRDSLHESIRRPEHLSCVWGFAKPFITQCPTKAA